MKMVTNTSHWFCVHEKKEIKKERFCSSCQTNYKNLDRRSKLRGNPSFDSRQLKSHFPKYVKLIVIVRPGMGKKVEFE